MPRSWFFLGAFKSNSTNGLIHQSLAIIATSGLVLGAAYYLWTIQRMFFGPFNVKGNIVPQTLSDLTAREYIVLIPLVIAVLVFGIFPQPLLNIIGPFAQQFVTTVLENGKQIGATLTH